MDIEFKYVNAFPSGRILTFENEEKNLPRLITSRLNHDYIVGGAVRDLLLGREPNDYDLLYNDPEKYQRDVAQLAMMGNVEKVLESARDYHPVAKRVKFRVHYTSYTLDLDLLYQSDYKKFFKSFDFTINCLVYKDNKLYQFDDRALVDLQQRRLRLRNLSKKGRIQKFEKMGFFLENETDLVNMIEKIEEKNSSSAFRLGYGSQLFRKRSKKEPELPIWSKDPRDDALIEHLNLIKSEDTLSLLLLSNRSRLRNLAKKRCEQIQNGIMTEDSKFWRSALRRSFREMAGEITSAVLKRKV